MFRQAMSAPTVRLKVLPLANKPRYEKSFIGQLFTGDAKDSSAKARSPIVVRAKTDSQPEPKPNTKVEVRRPDTRVRTLEPTRVDTPPAEVQSGHNSLERGSPTPPARAASSSPTPRARSQSPLANLTSRKGGKKIKIDLKKGKCAAEDPLSVLLYQ